MKKVIVYGTATCPYCIKAKKFLEESGVEYEEMDVSSDQSAADEAVKKSGQMGVPVVDVEGEIIVGFDRDAIERAVSS